MTPFTAMQPGYGFRMGVALLLVALADALFFNQPVGISLFLFATILTAAVTAVHPAAFRDGALLLKAGALLAALLPLAENASPLSFLIALVATAIFSLSLAGRLRRGPALVGGQVAKFLLVAPFRLVRDFFRWRMAARRLNRRVIRFAAIAVWLMPLTLGAVFVALFGVANPVIDYWLSLIDFLALLDFIEIARLAFWLLVLIAVWAFLRPRLRKIFRRAPRPASPAFANVPLAVSPKTAKAIEDIIFGRAAIFRALVVFNTLFAVQTVLDAAYLWGGIALPDGLTYAAYAHRGAYPLIVTALLAAGFVLAALRPGSATSNDSLIRRLVYFWVVQNIVLVISSILRLNLYVGIYSLTYWRIAAFIWMGLVAAGLALIIVRIALGKSNEWLLSANLLTLSTTLYACGFINFAGLTAEYNVEHSLEMTGEGIALDTCYLRSLGPDAFPAIDRFLYGAPKTSAQADLAATRKLDEAFYRRQMESWRAWTFRDWRLMHYLDSKMPATVYGGSEDPTPSR